ncbi:MAG: ASCH domain-containing protein [Puniceicoccaceae bacterium]
MTRRKRIQFWGRDKDDDSLVLEILRGEKTATVCEVDDYYVSDGDFDDGNLLPGELVEVYDLRENLRCLIQITEVYKVRWDNIPEKLWRGEACRDEKHFKDAHIFCWPEYNITDEFEMMATHFKLIEEY